MSRSIEWLDPEGLYPKYAPDCIISGYDISGGEKYEFRGETYKLEYITQSGNMSAFEKESFVE